MVRQKQIPWLQRHSRLLIGAIATIGIVDTAYLTWTKYSGGANACGTEACNIVLSSPYANVNGLPLSGFGLLAYIAAALLALVPLAVLSKVSRDKANELQEYTWLALLVLTTAMAVFSGYLLYLLFVVIKAACPFCLVSAACSIAIFVLTLFGKNWEDLSQALLTTIGSGALVLIATFIFYSGIAGAGTAGDDITTTKPLTAPIPQIGWQITSKSSPAEIALAEHLTQKGAKMYGAYWCPHCHEQKQLFGRAAFEKVDYVECGEDSPKANVAACKAASITGFPTWTFNGNKVPGGVQKLEDLAQLTGFSGAKNFRYSHLFGK
jgi:uncharacterized membrane protein/glutaredoxin